MTMISLMLAKAGKLHNTQLRAFTSTSRPFTRLAGKRYAPNRGLHVHHSDLFFFLSIEYGSC